MLNVEQSHASEVSYVRMSSFSYEHLYSDNSMQSPPYCMAMAAAHPQVDGM